MDLEELQKLYYTIPSDDTENVQAILKFASELKTNSKKSLQDASFIEQTLLKLSIIRKLYSSDQRCRNTDSLNSEILEYLFECMKIENQFVNFSASKALVYTLKSISHKYLREKVDQVIFIFLSFGESVNVGMYALQSITELMKTFRKDANTTTKNITVKEKVNTCLSLLCSQWDNITTVLASRDDLSPLVLEQYLSLCLECLRLLLLTAETTIAFNFLSSLPIMMKLVVAGCSPFCNVRFTNVLRKVIRNNNGNRSELTVSLFHSLDFQSFQSVANFALENWFQHVSRGVYDMFIIEYNIMQDSSSVEYNLVSKSDISISHVEQTFLRKYLLLTLEMISFATNSTNIVSQCRPLYDFLSLLKSLSLQNVHHSLSDKLIVLFLRKLILYLVLEEDGVLVGTLSSLFKLSELIEHLPPLVVQAFSIHHFFLQFVTSIGFDNSTVLDFIISIETDFDLFLANYLKLISSDSGGTSLALACQERDAISVKHSTNQFMEGQDTESVKVSSDSTNQSMEGQDTESVKVSSDQETFCDSVVSEVTKTSYDDSDGEGIEEITLDKLLNCFSRLYTQLENAKTRNLVTGKKIAVISEILDRIEMMA